MDIKKIEKRALIAGAVINLIMAVSGWYAYFLSGSEALLLDGNYSFITVVSTLVAIRIAAVKSKRSKLFPFGQFVFEALYSLVKGLMIIGLLLVAVTSNLSKIVHFLDGSQISMVNTDVMMLYGLAMSALCFSASFFYKLQNKKVNNHSSLLRAESAGSMVDGMMSAGIGAAAVLISFIDPQSSFGFINYIGDAILVLILCLVIGKMPFELTYHSFIELAGGTLQNRAEKKHIQEILSKYLSAEQMLVDDYISKTGSSYLVIAYLSAAHIDKLGFEKTIEFKQQIITDLHKHYQNTTFEMVLV
ncbi:cation transporter [Psychromonas aquimarina]|uniref:cation transporter n=1 Tax=Psychromonas aquimarina TaxID=444919 RepID=UPI00041CFA2C|nr:cation transporter [Psychromonas aquimarina]